jgi:hypothetical protein
MLKAFDTFEFSNLFVFFHTCISSSFEIIS